MSHPSTEKRLIFVAIACAMLTACAPPKGPDPDQKVRREIFIECLRTVPNGPQATKYNDWSEVVSECGSQAYYISLNLGEREVEK
jgi:hypothetical protein